MAALPAAFTPIRPLPLQLRTQTAAAGTPLPRKHRALVALYMLEDPRQSREEILRLNNVSEIDLAEYEEEWLRLRCRHVVAV